MSKLHRRSFLRQAAAFSAGFSGFCKLMASSSDALDWPQVAGYGPLIPDPEGLLDLPRGFAYRIISEQGDSMDDGLLVPGKIDGSCAFPGPKGRTILIRNHELIAPDVSAFGATYQLLNTIPSSDFYDFGGGVNPGIGGCTTLIHDRSRGRVIEFLSLAGTLRNCSGGPTPWGSWLSCEETVQGPVGGYTKEHGYVFEVPATSVIGRAAPIPLTDMGRFNHEGAAVDPRTGIIYMTEDRSDGLFYRFIPNSPGNLQMGGMLQALKIIGQFGMNTSNHNAANLVPVGTDIPVEWVTMTNVTSPGDTLRDEGHAMGAAQFTRGEGMYCADGSIFFTATDGGLLQLGQIWELQPDPQGGTDILRLHVEPNNASLMDRADNLTVAPWGDLFVCEDGSGDQYLVGITPAGTYYKFARNALNGNELTGATFSPDGEVLYVNIRNPGTTVAITGPF